MNPDHIYSGYGPPGLHLSGQSSGPRFTSSSLSSSSDVTPSGYPEVHRGTELTHAQLSARNAESNDYSPETSHVQPLDAMSTISSTSYRPAHSYHYSTSSPSATVSPFVAPGMNSHLGHNSNEANMPEDYDGYRWWIPAEGISRRILNMKIQKYLGPNACAKPGMGDGDNTGVDGYKIRADRNFTSAMVEDLRQLTRNTDLKTEAPPRDPRHPQHYEDTREHDDRGAPRRRREFDYPSYDPEQDFDPREYDRRGHPGYVYNPSEPGYPVPGSGPSMPVPSQPHYNPRAHPPHQYPSGPHPTSNQYPNVPPPSGQYSDAPQPNQYPNPPQTNQYPNAPPSYPMRNPMPHNPGYAPNPNYPNYPPYGYPPNYPPGSGPMPHQPGPYGAPPSQMPPGNYPYRY